MTIPFDPQTFVVAAAVVFGAYVVFGISAFGAAMFTVPIPLLMGASLIVRVLA